MPGFPSPSPEIASTFEIDARMDNTLSNLQRHYGLQSRADVVRKAVTLLWLASEMEAPDGSISIRSPCGLLLKIPMRCG